MDQIPMQYRGFLEVFQNQSSAAAALKLSKSNTELMTGSFERFVKDYDGKIVFEPHLRLQTLSLYRSLPSLKLNQVWDVEEITPMFEQMVQQYNGHQRRVNISMCPTLLRVNMTPM